jgi:sideroflexin-5
MDNNGSNVAPGETSSKAAAQGVYLTTASRALLQAPVYFLPPLLLSTLGPLSRLLLIQPQLTVPVTTFLLLTSFGIGLPATVAMFPQISMIRASAVEPAFQSLINPQTQKPYTHFYYNKGL